MKNNQTKKGYLCGAWKKAVLGLAVLATVSAGLPTVASAQDLQQAQAQMQMANCNANYTNEETNLSRDTYN
ncbi:MAG: hypothetical protein KGQ70_07000, partial [Alphaproteobacteria bacterium]|nr:hypothetical protein [Alphaproteobacteria bacterium]